MKITTVIAASIGAVLIGGVATGFYLESREDKEKSSGTAETSSSVSDDITEEVDKTTEASQENENTDPYKLLDFSVKESNEFSIDNSEEYASHAYEYQLESDSEYTRDIKLDETEIFGLPAYRFSRHVQSGSLNIKSETYYLDHNGRVYQIGKTIPANDDGTIAADIQKLIYNTTLK